jgi:hypothetical protein
LKSTAPFAMFTCPLKFEPPAPVRNSAMWPAAVLLETL